jgi:predicted DNA-binding transcriptional regulator YafY
MRADRLISIIMLLQAHERMTAEELSEELEVSTRTIYRDVIALNNAGIPIYTDSGPGGGIALLESYRTTLTMMSDEEAQALFMLSIPHALVELGVGQKLKTALLKLAATIPAKKQSAYLTTQQRIYLDTSPWQPVHEPAAHLRILHEAIWQNHRIRLVFRGSFEAEIEIELEPLGLVAKMNAWYLVGRANGFLRVIDAAGILEVEDLGKQFSRDDRFDLVEFWSQWCADTINQRAQYRVSLRMSAGLLSKLEFYIGPAIKYTVTGDSPGIQPGWKDVEIIFDNYFQAREKILSFGRAAQVLEPEALRLSVVDFAWQIVDFYQAEK